MSPRSVVQAKEGRRSQDAGVVESVTKDQAGNVVAVRVDWDSDHRRETFKPDELRVLQAH